MTNQQVMTEEVEAAIARIIQAHANIPLGRELVLSVVPEVESHVDIRLRSFTHRDESAQTRLGQFWIKENLSGLLSTWEGRKRLIKLATSQDFFGDQLSQDFFTLIDLRNAIMHGNGRITPLQAKSVKTYLDLRKRLHSGFNIHTNGMEIVFSRTDNARIASTAIGFLRKLDVEFLRS
ncbi:hypothetical protein NHL51_02645 [Leucobacter sp. gxy201]|uniref:hypothetical protein n=1 Tax=Leucobacter sp. gxy201 TaxID=2957200 RepID=UPI003DA1BD70